VTDSPISGNSTGDDGRRAPMYIGIGAIIAIILIVILLAFVF